MIRFLLLIVFTFSSIVASSQQIKFSSPVSSDDKNMNFEVLGKMNDLILIYKNVRWKHSISLYNNDMQLVSTADLEFIPGKTFNVDFVVNSDNIYCVYQYHSKGVVYCMAAKLSQTGGIIGEPIELDKAEVGLFGDTRIYNLVNSDDKSKIMVYKLQKKKGILQLQSLLYDKDFQLLRKSLLGLPSDDQKDDYDNFLLDNDGNLVFTRAEKAGLRNAIGGLKLYTVLAEDIKDTMYFKEVELEKNYIDGVKLKVDNINKAYIINSIYFREKRGNVEGFFSAIVKQSDFDNIQYSFTPLDNSLKSLALTDGSVKTALNNFYIKNVIVKKDGGYIIITEDFYTRQNNSGWNRYDYFYGYPSWSQYGYYYSPFGNQFYRPYSRFGSSSQSIRYIYNKILIMGYSANATYEWGTVVDKEQEDDENDNYLSFTNYTGGGEIRFLFNKKERRRQILQDYGLIPDGTVTKNPVLKSQDKGYEFMPQFAKQVSAKQIVIPCTYRNYVCFARVEF